MSDNVLYLLHAVPWRVIHRQDEQGASVPAVSAEACFPQPARPRQGTHVICLPYPSGLSAARRRHCVQLSDSPQVLIPNMSVFFAGFLRRSGFTSHMVS